MSHFAKVENGIVTKVLVIEEDVLNELYPNETWIQTSYNTYAGKHALGGTPLRMNYAGEGFIYDEVRDAFYSPKPYDSWILDEETCLWCPPVPYPDDGKMYVWDEMFKNWIILPETN
jgi:hypothetical protein